MGELKRFLDGQRFGYETALKEMIAGEKRNHWIWYVFPQIKGLGHSPNSQLYGIRDSEEAREYLAHPILGARLRDITNAVLTHEGIDIRAIMGSGIDAMKFKSSMTLFDAVSPNDIFGKALDVFYDGKWDQRTLAIIL